VGRVLAQKSRDDATVNPLEAYFWSEYRKYAGMTSRRYYKC